jgi:hypothetical protein
MIDLGDGYFYITGYQTSGNSQPSMRKIQFSTATAQWGKYMGCHETECQVGESASVLNDDGSIIYNYMIVGTGTKYTIFFGLQETSGAYVTSVYRSSTA